LREWIWYLNNHDLVTPPLAFAVVLDSHGDTWSAAHLEQWRASMATYARSLLPISVDEIDLTMVLRCLEPQWKRAPITMDRVRGRIGEILFAESSSSLGGRFQNREARYGYDPSATLPDSEGGVVAVAGQERPF
jgi:hypothetical protein